MSTCYCSYTTCREFNTETTPRTKRRPSRCQDWRLLEGPKFSLLHPGSPSPAPSPFKKQRINLNVSPSPHGAAGGRGRSPCGRGYTPRGGRFWDTAAGAASNRVTVDSPHRRARLAIQELRIHMEWVASPHSVDVFFYGRVCE